MDRAQERGDLELGKCRYQGLQMRQTSCSCCQRGGLAGADMVDSVYGAGKSGTVDDAYRHNYHCAEALVSLHRERGAMCRVLSSGCRGYDGIQ